MKYLLAVIPFFIVSCSSVNSVNTDKTTANSNPVSLSQPTKSTGAALSVNIDFKSFAAKASSNGTAAKTVNDIQSAKLYLTTSNGTNPLLAANVKFSSSTIAYPTGSSSKTYTFFNVPAGTYYVAAELFSDTAGTNNIIEPITYDFAGNGDTAFGMNGKRGLTLSTNSATVTSPAMTYSFSGSSNSFSVSPKLLNAVGANLDTTLTPQAGNTTPTGTITLQ